MNTAARAFPPELPRLPPPIEVALMVVDSSSDGLHAAYAALLLRDGSKPRLILGTAHGISTGMVEIWGAKLAARRARGVIGPHAWLTVFTDCQTLTLRKQRFLTSYHWMSRKDPAIRLMDRLARSLRLAAATKPGEDPQTR